jgi:Ca2+-binding RTX toxin-like protein
MLSDIITENGLDLGIATTGNDSIIMSQLPPDQLAYFTASPFPDAIALLEGDDNVLNDNTGRIFYGNQGSDTIIGGGGNDTLFGGQDIEQRCRQEHGSTAQQTLPSKGMGSHVGSDDGHHR